MARILTSDGRLILDRVAVSRAGEHKNAKGLLGRTGLEAGEGLLLSDPTGSIHMFFMRFPIDAVFVGKAASDGGRVVVATKRGLRPWTGMVPLVRGAAGVLELPVGSIDASGTVPSDVVRIG